MSRALILLFCGPVEPGGDEEMPQEDGRVTLQTMRGAGFALANRDESPSTGLGGTVR